MKKIIDRQNEILKLVEEKNRLAISELSKHFKVTEITIRRDVKELEKDNKIIREHGFVTYKQEEILPVDIKDFFSFPPDINNIAPDIIGIAEKVIKKISEKKEIVTGKYPTIFLDDGYICYEIARRIKNANIITTSLKTAIISANNRNNPDSKIKLFGDTLNKNNFVLHNRESNNQILKKCDLSEAFLEADGFDTKEIKFNDDKMALINVLLKMKNNKLIALLRPDLFEENSDKKIDPSKFDFVFSSEYFCRQMSTNSKEKFREFESNYSKDKQSLIISKSIIVPFPSNNNT